MKESHNLQTPLPFMKKSHPLTKVFADLCKSLI